MPVAWEELAAITSGDHWNIVSGPERLAGLADDPWAEYWAGPQRLGPALQALTPALSRRREREQARPPKRRLAVERSETPAMRKR